MKAFKMALPRSLSAAAEASGESFAESKFLAGGTDLVAELKERTQTPDTVVNLKHIPGLDTIEVSDAGIQIGALCKLIDVAEHPEIRANWPALARTIEKTATPNIRNVGTIGGNLCQRVRCWYYRDETYPCLKKGGSICYAQEGENEFHAIFDNQICCAPHPSNVAPVLIAYDARLGIAGLDEPRGVSAERFFHSPLKGVTSENILEPTEILTGIVLPRSAAHRTSAYVEARERQSYDWALCGATVNLHLDGRTVRSARIVLNAVAPTPQRRPDLEKLLKGQTLDEALITRVGAAAAKGATPLRDNGHKVQLVTVLVARALREAMEG